MTHAKPPEDKHSKTDQRWQQSHTVQKWLTGVGITYCGLTALLWWTTKEGIHSGQRAYMLVESVGLTQALTANQPVVAQIVVKNTGQTPALHSTISVIMALDTIEVEDVIGTPTYQSTVDFGAGQTRISRTSGTIAVIDRTKTISTLFGIASTEPLVTVAQSLTDEQIARIRKGELRLYVYADISYADVFQAWWNRDEITRTCFWLINTGEFNGCTAHNRIR